MKQKTFTCDTCQKTYTLDQDDVFTSGYGTMPETDEKFCFNCCADGDMEFMRENGRTILWLVKNKSGYEVTNWPGTLRVKVVPSQGKHNIAGIRHDFWFMFEGAVWWGVSFGHYTQIAHCKRLKADPAKYFWYPEESKHQLTKVEYDYASTMVP